MVNEDEVCAAYQAANAAFDAGDYVRFDKLMTKAERLSDEFFRTIVSNHLTSRQKKG